MFSSICYFYFLIIYTTIVAEGAPQFHVALQMPNFVEQGSRVTMTCGHDVERDQLHKVEWLREDRKIFQFVKGRSPPYRSFSTPGAEIDVKHSNDKQVILRNLRFEASGRYSCQVSTDTPIYTKPSNDEQLTVIVKQKSNPKITGRKLGLYSPGEQLELNCTSSASYPEADITWFINGHKVDDALVSVLPSPRIQGDSNLISANVQLTLTLSEEHAFMVAGPGFHQLLPSSVAAPRNIGPSSTGLTSGQLHVTCLSTIPEFQGLLEDPENHLQPSGFRYADRKVASVIVEVEVPLPSPDPASAATRREGSSIDSSATAIITSPIPVQTLLLILLTTFASLFYCPHNEL